MPKRTDTSKAAVTPPAKPDAATPPAEETTTPPVGDAPPAEETTTPPADTPAPAEETTTPPAEETDSDDSDAEPAAKPAKGKAKVDLRGFVLDLLKKHLPADTASAWLEKVAQAIENGRIVAIAEVDGANVLEIHKDLLYADRNSVRTLAAKHGRNYKVNVNQVVLDKFKS